MADTNDDPIWLVNLRRLVGKEHGRRTEVAKSAGMKLGQLQKILSGGNLKPQVNTLARLAVACGAELEDLFTRPEGESGHDREIGQGSSLLDRVISEANAQEGTWRADVADAVAALARALSRDRDRSADSPRPKTSGR
ncbi:MAG TPA: helix-turn-helix domain-containing protein [Rhizomicrobium sp.]|nr:helix-turn-helix domain-containing protein [Rhizomicrobium sp.]